MEATVCYTLKVQGQANEPASLVPRPMAPDFHVDRRELFTFTSIMQIHLICVNYNYKMYLNTSSRWIWIDLQEDLLNDIRLSCWYDNKSFTFTSIMQIYLICAKYNYKMHLNTSTRCIWINLRDVLMWRFSSSMLLCIL